METMIEQLLDFSRLQAGRVQVELAPLDLGEVVSEIVDALELHLLESEVVVATNGLRVIADHYGFGYVLRNLMTNAAKYSHAVTRIEIPAEQIGGPVEHSQPTQGRGIRPEDPRRLLHNLTI